MKEIDPVLDAKPELAIEFIRLDIRNRQAWKELYNFELTGDFLWLHPILQKKKVENEFRRLKKENPDEFMAGFVNNAKNITRYKSMLNNEKHKSREEKEAWQNHIARCQDENEIMKNILNE
jgi:hypothetical protein